MIFTLLVLIAFQLAGELLIQLSGLPVSGPIAGLLLLLIALTLVPQLAERLRQNVNRLIALLPLLLVPPSVSIIGYGDLLRDHGTAITAGLLISLIVALVVTGLALKGRTRA